ncbi:MAG: serine/threonine-protein kinase [Phycisphaerae bacterium]
MDTRETMTVLLTTGHGSEPEAVEVPRRVGTVKLGGMLGEGSGGAVFGGYDEALNRRVAVKLLHRRRGVAHDPAMIELAKGVRSAARIRHPNILTIHAVETVNQMPVIVMEYVDGTSLRDLLLRSGALDLSLALYVMRSVVSAVAALHDANVIHRDLKPANVLFDSDGEARVCDFGLACEFDVTAYKGQAGNIGGSPLYMAPEMFDGHVSPQSDVYALGIVLFEVLAGAPPFSAQTISEIKACHIVRQPPLWQLGRREIPEELCEIAGRALRKQRFLRYKAAGHLLRAIERVAAPERRDDTLRMRLAELVSAQQSDATAERKSSVKEPSARTTFDLIAERAKQKRERRPE